MNARAETTTVKATPTPTKATPEERRSRIAEVAYLKAEKRGFTPGQHEQDWLEAEQEVEKLGEYWLP
jgi:hypothetical protein